MQKSDQVLNKTDIAVLVVDAVSGMTEEDHGILRRFRQKSIPFLVVYNKTDLVDQSIRKEINPAENVLWISTETGENIHELKELIAKQVPTGQSKYPIVADLLQPSDFVVLVVPIDTAAPKGRLILPQQQTIRDILEANGAAIVIKETELSETLKRLGKAPRLVITDSQVFARVSEETPAGIPLTSFSILFARHKGNLALAVKGVTAIDRLQAGDTVLISEGCTHHRQCDDIGTRKLPRWMEQYTGKKLEFKFTSGTEFPEDFTGCKMVVHCGGCMLNEREMKYRLQCAEDQELPITNYGILIAYMQGILARSLAPFPDFASHLTK